MMNPEAQRLHEANAGTRPWKKWGPYLSERQWGTVREDYSADGAAWEYLPHDHARSRAYRWGEDGLGGFSDEYQYLCLSLALWNGKDPILKERLFGLTNNEGNHGEDVKEIYYYLDATPTKSYLKMLYKYPQAAFPYEELLQVNRQRGREGMEFELWDSPAFDHGRYFDVFIEYAKADVEDFYARFTIINRGDRPAELHLLPHVWFRNRWSWLGSTNKPHLRQKAPGVIALRHPRLSDWQWIAEGQPELLFCENETNAQRLFNQPLNGLYPKDAINDCIVSGNPNAVNPANCGTKAAAHYRCTLPPGGQKVVRLRLVKADEQAALPFDGKQCDLIFQQRIREADAYYAELQTGITDLEQRRIQRQAFAGMLWSKQFYYFDIPIWLRGDPAQPKPPIERQTGRNHEWLHLNNADIISMPDKWEYPWYAAWDLAFHCIPLALLDAEFAKQQLVLLTREWYMHPAGQLPAYEWAFGDVNPPVHAWAAYRVFEIDRKTRGGDGDLAFLERVFHKLMLNFTWWVNRKDTHGRNIFQGGFLGLDNIGVFDRSKQLPDGVWLDQADGTSWMAMYCLNLLRIAIELGLHNPVYEDIATKFFEHFLMIAHALTNIGGSDPLMLEANKGGGLWDEEDQFFYDRLCTRDCRSLKLKVRSIVGLIPLFAVETLEPENLQKLPGFNRRLQWFLNHRPDLAGLVSRWFEPGRGDRRLLSLLRGHRMKMLLRRMLDPDEFLSDYGIRALSKFHERNPYVLNAVGREWTVSYQPGESTSGLFGGNSNWRGPIWFPVNFLIIESLQKFHYYYGDDFKVECPTGSGVYLNLNEVADEITRRLLSIFLPDKQGKRPMYGPWPKLRDDPQFRDHLMFFEYFHGDSGRGVGANHQTGWTGLIAKLLQPRGHSPYLPPPPGME